MAAYPASTGQGVSGPAVSGAGTPRQSPYTLTSTNEGPTPQELRATWRAYNGQFEESNKGPLTAQPNVPDLNILSNRVRPIVNTGVDFLFGPMLTIQVDDDQAQAILDAVWGDDDQRMTLLSKSAINGGVYGHVFVKVVPPKKGKPSSLRPPRLVLLNPETMCVETDPDDADLVTCYRIEYACDDPDTHTPMRKRQEIRRLDPDGDDATTATTMDVDTQWSIQDFIAQGLAANNWQPVGEPVLWPYEYPPIIDWQNYPSPNSHWGQRDVTDGIVALNRQLRLVESNINKIGYLQGHNYLWSTGTDTTGLKPTPGEIMDLGAPDAALHALIASGDLAQLMAFAEAIRGDMDEESGIPGVALGRLQDIPRGQLSGITMRLLYASALARNEHKRRLYGQGIRQACQTVLVLCGMAMDAVKSMEIKLTWQDPLPSDDLAEAQAWQAKLQLGYSQTTAIEETGGNPELEEQRKADEQQQQTLAFAHGAGTPPMDPSALAASAQMGNSADDSQQQQQADGKQQSQATPQQMQALNSPQARLQRARVTATAKG